MRAKALSSSIVIAAGLLIVWTGLQAAKKPQRPAGASTPLPEFTHTAAESWLNSPPLTVAHLRGRVVVLEVWSADCVNCLRSFSWVKQLERRFGPRGVVVIGVHSPEFEREKDRGHIRSRLREHDIASAIMLDDDFSYWRALGNRYWSAFYLVDRHGRIRRHMIGETHAGSSQAENFEHAILELLEQP